MTSDIPSSRPLSGRWMATRAAQLMGILCAFSIPASAYTDPGTGTMLWQIILAGAVGASFYIRQIIGWFKKKK